MPSPERHHLSSPTSDLSSPRAERGSSSRDLGPGSSPGRQLGVLHLKRADLPPSVRYYVDNLNVQVRELLKAHGAKNLHDFKRLIKERKVRVEAVENLQKLLNAYANAVRTGERPPEDLEFTEDYEDPETGETREIRLDLNEALQTTSDFFKQFGLDELRAALPKSIHLTDEQKELVRATMREGFNFALVMPPLPVVINNFEHIIEAMSMVVTSRSKGYPVEVTGKLRGPFGEVRDADFPRSIHWLARQMKHFSVGERPYVLLSRLDRTVKFLKENKTSPPNHEPMNLDEFLIADRMLADKESDDRSWFHALITPLPDASGFCSIVHAYEPKNPLSLKIAYTYKRVGPGRTIPIVKIEL